MTKYIVELHQIAWHTVEVEADSFDEAREKVVSDIESGTYVFPSTNEGTDYDVYEVREVQPNPFLE